MIQLLKHGPRYDSDLPTPKAVWFDIDNTLVDNESPGLPSQRFLDAAHETAKVAHIGLATARPLQKAKHIIDACGMNGLSVISNGAQIYDGANGTMAVEYVLPAAETLQIIRTLQDRGIQHWVQDDGIDHFWLGEPAGADTHNLGKYSKSIDNWQPAEGENRQIISDYFPTKPLVVVADGATENDVNAIANIVESVVNVTSFIAHEVNNKDGSVGYKVFIIDTRANKRTALHTVTEMLGLDRSETMAVGDGPNDTVIVEGAGTGVAVGNAVEQTKQVATYIAPAWSDDGAAIALEELVL